MPPTNPTAQAVAAALDAGGGLKALVDQLYSEIGPLDRAAIFDVGPGPDGYLIALPGYGPLDDPAAFVRLGRLFA